MQVLEMDCSHLSIIQEQSQGIVTLHWLYNSSVQRLGVALMQVLEMDCSQLSIIQEQSQGIVQLMNSIPLSKIKYYRRSNVNCNLMSSFA